MHKLTSFRFVAACLALIAINGAQGQVVMQRLPAMGVDSFVARYTGAAEGSQVYSFRRTEGGYRYTERLVIPRVMHREVTVDFDHYLKVRRSQSVGAIGDRPIESSVVYNGDHARGSARPLQARRSELVRIDTVLPARAFDGLALYPMLLSHRWSVGTVDTLVLFDTDELTITRQTARATARENIALPAGTVAAIRVELSTSQLPVTLWLTEQAPHRLIKIASANGETIRVSTSAPSNER